MERTTEIMLNLATELGELRERQRGLQEHIRFIEDRLNTLKANADAARAPETGKKRAQAELSFATAERSLPQKVWHLLQANPNRAFKASQVAKALGEKNLSAVRTSLFRLYRSKRAERIGPGRYRARADRNEHLEPKGGMTP